MPISYTQQIHTRIGKLWKLTEVMKEMMVGKFRVRSEIRFGDPPLKMDRSSAHFLKYVNLTEGPTPGERSSRKGVLTLS